MKRMRYLFYALLVMALSSCTQNTDQVNTEALASETVETDFFELKIYHLESPDQMTQLDSYLKEALLPAKHRAGIENIGVFKPIEGLNEEINYLIVLTPYASLEQFEQLPALLKEDQEYMQAGKAYIDAAHDAAPYARIESMLMRSFSATPKMALPELSTPRSERVYELRSYEAATEKLYELKVEMFNEGESQLFQDLKFNPVFFAEVLSSAHMPHLVYMTTHADTTAQRLNWDAFRVHPEWERMKNLDRYQNTVSNITIYLLYPTAYSDY